MSTMGCVASAIAVRKQNKAKVQPVPSPNTLRGDLLSRREARQRREKSVAEHHDKSKKMAKTIAFNTMAEKEMMSTSTEQSYRSGRGFLINAASSSQAASEQGSSSTVSDEENLYKREQPPATGRVRTDAASTRLPYSVPEEESLHQDSVKGQDSNHVKGQGTSLHSSHNGIDGQSREYANENGNNGNSRTVTNSNEPQVKGHNADLEVSRTDGDSESKSKKPARVRFEETRTDVAITSEVRTDRNTENNRTKLVESVTMATADSLPAG